MLSAENSNGWGLHPKAPIRRSFDVPRSPLLTRPGRQSEPPHLYGPDGSGSADQDLACRIVDDKWPHEGSRMHQLSYSGAGRFWKPPDEQDSRSGRSWWKRDRASTTSSQPGPYMHPHPPPPNSPLSIASSQTFDRQPSIDGARSHRADSAEIWERQSISSIQVSAAEEVELVSQGPSPRLLQPEAPKNKIAQDERQKKTALHLMQVFAKEEERVRQLVEAENSPSQTTMEDGAESHESALHEKSTDEQPLRLSFLDMPSQGDSWSTEQVLSEMALNVPRDSVSATLQAQPEHSARILGDEDLPEVYSESQSTPSSDYPEVFYPPEGKPSPEVADGSHLDTGEQSMFAQLNLIKQRLPYRYSNVPPGSVLLLPGYLNELSTSQSVLYHRKAKPPAPVQSNRKLPNLKKYNTLPDEPFPLPPQKPNRRASEGEAQRQAANIQAPPSQQESLATTGMMINIEPDIDPRTGKPYARSFRTDQRRSH